MNHPQPRLEQVKLQRVSASGVLSVRQRDGGTRLERLYQEGAAKIRLPARGDGPLEAILINTAGGLTGGDRLAWAVEAGEDTAVTLTTQACEKIYRATTGHAEVTCRISGGSGARIAWLPQETIVFDRSAFRRRLDVDLAEDAEALLVEATIFGRRAMGETVRTAIFRDRWRVRCGQRLIHAEDFAIGPDVEAAIGRKAGLGGAGACATVLLVGPSAATHLDTVRHIVDGAGGASAWRVGSTGKLLARLVATDGYALRERLVPLVAMLNGQAGLPKTWSL
jgi:urease accessory protein